MLARVVENVYWLARYLERAENTARLVNVNTNLLLDLPAGYAPGWMLLVDISGSREAFDALDGRAEDASSERRVVRFQRRCVRPTASPIRRPTGSRARRP